jgi:hypothetical protein
MPNRSIKIVDMGVSGIVDIKDKAGGSGKYFCMMFALG